MKLPIIIAACLMLALASCTRSHPQEKTTTHPTPKALDDSRSSAYDLLSSKRGGISIVRSLYEELEGNTPALKHLEDKLDSLSDSKQDSLRVFNWYSNKNEDYYRSATSLSERIGDSVLRKSIVDLITASEDRYNMSVSQHTALLKAIEAGTLKLDDLHTALMIVKTLPIIASYQHEKLPPATSLKGYADEQGKTIKYENTLLKK
ncbi:hypothetical protein F0L74_12515 [Chitinophaga agrisoli]|uniref:Lipoprotein n=1 Tax=Chitinophaga agrisoli TaxID=2607653 RepID=A0A5B2VX18_9BACT|nr:hypothetical protein [Chitinophaga agrisoli]KAA2243324.1 hypothetical protein F0L74_12515 [Chitinophaga agrisoli]